MQAVLGQDAVDYVSIDDAMSHGYHNFDEYIYFVLNKQQSLHTCKTCGGINHYSSCCPTAPGSVPEDILRAIRYPLGVRPWVFGGKGKGKGKGKGRGGRGRHGGRGVMAAWQQGDEEERDTAPPPPPPSDPPPPPEGDEAETEVYDDYDGWNS